MSPDEAEFVKRLEKVGELEVRHNVTIGNYMGRHKAWAHRWITGLDQERASVEEARREASRREDIRIARSANRAAWTAAISAVIAIIISIIALYLSWRGLNRR